MAQALFANQRETNLASTIALVEEVLGELGHPRRDSRIDDATALHAWQIAKGSAITRDHAASTAPSSRTSACARS